MRNWLAAACVEGEEAAQPGRQAGVLVGSVEVAIAVLVVFECLRERSAHGAMSDDVSAVSAKCAMIQCNGRVQKRRAKGRAQARPSLGAFVA